MIHFLKVYEQRKEALCFLYFVCEIIVTLNTKNMGKETTYLRSKLKLGFTILIDFK